MVDLSEEKFSTIEDAALHRALLADQKLKCEKTNGIVYLGSVILLYLLLAPILSWKVLILLWCMYLPVRTILSATKEREKMYRKYFELHSK
ncbi:hypothetical protein RED65_02068 [Oceanobacter sp. RED65]|uniref:Uncharacterized protein n=1 Tax=Bermanella marisrubri TaxID=207949 RepID=Q1MY10_9GAMM|nr:hypothetical protein RED65_02068 [Oceanobacter sp. RED65] [Bermanella marisrubri]